MKPKSWRECPSIIFESILWDVDLDYDSYESSKAETIHNISCNVDCVCVRNESILNEFWEQLTEEDFQCRLLNAKKHLERQLDSLKTYLA